MIVLVLVLVWVLALTPYALRRLGEWQVSSELDRFHRGLGALGQFFSGAEPGVAGTGGRDDGNVRIGDDAAAEAEAEAEAEAGTEADAAGRPPSRGRDARAPASGPVGGYRPSRQLVMRRRRIVTWLGASLAGSFVLGAIPWFRVLWDLTLVVLVVGVVYLASLVYVQRRAVLAAERAAKIVRLRTVRPPMRLDGGRTPALVAVGAVGAVGVAAAAGGGPSRAGDRPAVVALPRRPSFVLVDGPR